MNPNRGSFPKSPSPETPPEKRLRYEAWIIATHQTQMVDPAFDAVMAQPNHSECTYPSQKAAIRARCWQCVAGDDDANGVERIRTCDASRCPLWSVRPYKPEGKSVPVPAISPAEVRRGDHAAKAVAFPGSRVRAITGYCFECCGGPRETGTMQAVANCGIGHCALWNVRPRQSASAGNGFKPAENMPYEALAEPNGTGAVP